MWGSIEEISLQPFEENHGGKAWKRVQIQHFQGEIMIQIYLDVEEQKCYKKTAN